MAKYSHRSVGDIDPDAEIWKYIPAEPGGGGTREVLKFCQDVENHFGIYLTEKEWESPSLRKLATTISTKLASPGLSLRDIDRDARLTILGTDVGIILFGAPVVIIQFAFFFGGGTSGLIEASRLAAVIGIFIPMFLFARAISTKTLGRRRIALASAVDSHWSSYSMPLSMGILLVALSAWTVCGAPTTQKAAVLLFAQSVATVLSIVEFRKLNSRNHSI